MKIRTRMFFIKFISISTLQFIFSLITLTKLTVSRLLFDLPNRIRTHCCQVIYKCNTILYNSSSFGLGSAKCGFWTYISYFCVNLFDQFILAFCVSYKIVYNPRQSGRRCVITRCHEYYRVDEHFNICQTLGEKESKYSQTFQNHTRGDHLAMVFAWDLKKYMQHIQY